MTLVIGFIKFQSMEASRTYNFDIGRWKAAFVWRPVSGQCPVPGFVRCLLECSGQRHGSLWSRLFKTDIHSQTAVTRSTLHSPSFEHLAPMKRQIRCLMCLMSPLSHYARLTDTYMASLSPASRHWCSCLHLFCIRYLLIVGMHMNRCIDKKLT